MAERVSTATSHVARTANVGIILLYAIYYYYHNIMQGVSRNESETVQTFLRVCENLLSRQIARHLYTALLLECRCIIILHYPHSAVPLRILFKCIQIS